MNLPEPSKAFCVDVGIAGERNHHKNERLQADTLDDLNQKIEQLITQARLGGESVFVFRRYARQENGEYKVIGRIGITETTRVIASGVFTFGRRFLTGR